MSSSAIAAPDNPEAFADWFIQQDFPKNEYYQWAAIFEALIDGKDRSREVYHTIITPVYVAILTGDKYHNSEECPRLSNSSHIMEIDITEAQERGFELCKSCSAQIKNKP